MAYLLSFQKVIDANRVNKYGQTPHDIACSNDRDASKKQRIRNLFTGTELEIRVELCVECYGL